MKDRDKGNNALDAKTEGIPKVFSFDTHSKPSRESFYEFTSS